MKKSELKRLVEEYKLLKQQNTKTSKPFLADKLKQISHRYFHETGQSIEEAL